ncbi:MAG: 2-deoxyribose-5-phosphate aldolase [Gemmatimonadota bacterium]
MTEYTLSTDPILAALEATLLGPDLTREAVLDLARAAGEAGARGVCLPWVDLRELTRSEVLPRGLQRVTVAGFPLGDLPEDETLDLARRMHEGGADYVDIVFRRDRIRSGAIPPRPPNLPVRVILETSAWGSEGEMLKAAEALVTAGYRDLKTSTGFHPSQTGPQLTAVEALARTFGEDVTLKASGKIRIREEAAALLAAGASRLGASSLQSLLPA